METSFTSCSVRRRDASDHVEWHSNREDTPIVPPQRNSRKKSDTVKIKWRHPWASVSKGQQSLTTDSNKHRCNGIYIYMTHECINWKSCDVQEKQERSIIYRARVRRSYEIPTSRTHVPSNNVLLVAAKKQKGDGYARRFDVREREREMERGKEKNRGNKRERRKLRDAAPGVATPVSSMSKKHRLSPLLSTILRFHFTRFPSSSSFSARVLLLDICLFV